MTNDSYSPELELYKKYGVNVPVQNTREFVPAEKARFDSLIDKASQPLPEAQGKLPLDDGYNDKQTHSRSSGDTSAKRSDKSRR